MALILTMEGHSAVPSPWRQSWARHLPRCRPLVLPDVEDPDPVAWLRTLDGALATGRLFDTVIVAHGLSCMLVAGWVASGGKGLRGALLLDPIDPEANTELPALLRFRPTPRVPFGFRATVALSEQLDQTSRECAQDLAFSWQANVVPTPDPGADWPQGLGLIAAILR